MTHENCIGAVLRFRFPFLKSCVTTPKCLRTPIGLMLSSVCFTLFLLCFGVRAADLPPLDMVVDQSEVLSAEANASLRSKLAAFEREHQTAVVVVFIPSTAPDTIEERARYLANTWQIGRSYQGRGMLLLVALEDRRYRLEVSTALASVLTDEEAKDILALQLRPGLREGMPASAVSKLLDALGEHFAKQRTALSAPIASTASADTASAAPTAEPTKSYAAWIIGFTLLFGLILLGLAIWVSVAVTRWIIARKAGSAHPLVVVGGSAAILAVAAVATGWSILFAVVMTMVLAAMTWFGVRALIGMVMNAKSHASQGESTFGSSMQSDSTSSSSTSSDDSSSEGSASYEGRGASDSY